VNQWLTYLTDSGNWGGDSGIAHYIVQHLEYSFTALAFVILIGFPLGLFVGHTGRGAVVIAGTANALRSIPTLGLLTFIWIVFSANLPVSISDTGPSTFVLVILGIPAVLSNTYAGVQSVDPAARDAAKGMGMTGSQVLWRVEVPNALPLIISGIRNATLQLVATATIAAYISLGGLGRLILDGLAQQNYPEMVAGALLVAVLAIVLDLILATIQRFVVSRGLTGRYARSARSDSPMLTGVRQVEGLPREDVAA
jgi:osmoprotectant transport system permease protein